MKSLLHSQFWCRHFNECWIAVERESIGCKMQKSNWTLVPCKHAAIISLCENQFNRSSQLPCTSTCLNRPYRVYFSSEPVSPWVWQKQGQGLSNSRGFKGHNVEYLLQTSCWWTVKSVMNKFDNVGFPPRPWIQIQNPLTCAWIIKHILKGISFAYTPGTLWPHAQGWRRWRVGKLFCFKTLF